MQEINRLKVKKALGFGYCSLSFKFSV